MTTPAAEAVLDTNAVLDWLVFADPAGLALGSAVTTGSLRWRATAAMRAEFERVLPRFAQRLGVCTAGALANWDRWAEATTEPPPARWPQCTDADDQKFIDLALHLRAALLVSRDRALLRLRGRLRTLGVQVITQDEFAARGL